MQVDGFLAPGFERVRDAFVQNFADSGEIGAGFCALRHGETLVDIWGGHRDRTRTTAWTQDTLVPVHSTTKGVSAIVAALALDKSGVRYEERVSTLWPEFAAHGKGALTIAQALSHQAGVPGFVEPIDPNLWLDPPACAAAIAALAPLWPPGTASGYHPATWGYIVGEIVQRVIGRSLGTILREDICKPGSIDFHIGLPEGEDMRVAEMMKPRRFADFGPLTPIKRAAFLTAWASPRNAPNWARIEIPSANGHGTARAVAQLYEIFATGEIGGRRVLSAPLHSGLVAQRIFGQDLVLPFQLDWRSGLLGNAQMFYGPNREALGHSGSGGSCGLGDPATGISVGYVMNQQSHHLMGDPRALRLIEALYSCLSV